MAEPIFRVRDGAGNVVFDSRDAYAGLCVGVIDVPLNAVQVYAYPDYVGRTLKVCGMWGLDAWGASVDYALGYPRVTFSASSARTYVLFIV
ncbi:MAG: hypothetical protein IIZ92_28380 [Aquincola sp.]|nr:hypothetical protein [Aquincola sp.]